MGKIMKDGIQYGVGGIQKAEGITYDNTDSGMVATDVQGAIDELNNGLFIRKSNTISVNVSSGAGGTVNYSYPTAMPSGYEPISRCFMRTDAGGYGVIVVCPLYQNYINYYSTGSAPNPMTGYVVELCAKTNMYR